MPHIISLLLYLNCSRGTAELTEFLPPHDLNNSGPIRVYHIMQPLHMRESAFVPKIGLEGRKCRGEFSESGLQEGYATKDGEGVRGGLILWIEDVSSPSE